MSLWALLSWDFNYVHTRVRGFKGSIRSPLILFNHAIKSTNRVNKEMVLLEFNNNQLVHLRPTDPVMLCLLIKNKNKKTKNSLNLWIKYFYEIEISI
jgi:hypothetical protein